MPAPWGGPQRERCCQRCCHSALPGAQPRLLAGQPRAIHRRGHRSGDPAARGPRHGAGGRAGHLLQPRGPRHDPQAARWDASRVDHLSRLRGHRAATRHATPGRTQVGRPHPMGAWLNSPRYSPPSAAGRAIFGRAVRSTSRSVIDSVPGTSAPTKAVTCGRVRSAGQEMMIHIWSFWAQLGPCRRLAA